MLAFFNSLRAKPGLRGNAAQNLAHLQLWLDEADSDMPTPEDIIAVFNRRAEGMKGEYEVCNCVLECACTDVCSIRGVQVG